MKRVLILQSREKPEVLAAEREEYRRALAHQAELKFASTLDTGLAWDEPKSLLHGYDALIIGGSGEFDLHSEDASDERVATAKAILERVAPLTTYLFESNLPTLGVCFGHQLIAELRGGNVSTDVQQKKSGSYEIQLTEAGKIDALFSQLPESFIAQYGHRNSLTALPEDAVLLAKSGVCKFSALRYDGTRIYTVQFHPELTREDTIMKFKYAPEYLPEGMTPESLVKDSPDASRILPLFLDAIAK